MAEPFIQLLTSTKRNIGQLAKRAVATSCRTYHYNTGFCLRANTIPSYWHLNTKVTETIASKH